jgi:hypothetical protein
MEKNSANDALLADVWQKIPPEDKETLASEAQSTAISAVAVFIMFGWAIAVGFKEPRYLWGSFFVVPFLFQVLSRKAWNVMKPRTIVEYTAARATATHYASRASGQELLPSLQFKGTLERELSEGLAEREDSFDDESNLENRGPVPVWVTLFPDSLVIFSESVRGAKQELACSIYEDLSVTSEGFDDEALDQRKLLLSLRRPDGDENRWILRSSHISQLTACERKLQNAIEKRNLMLEQAAQSKQNAIKNEIQAALAG